MLNVLSAKLIRPFRLLLRAAKAQYLGVLVDNHLSWRPHALALQQWIRRTVGVLWRTRNDLSLKAKRLVYCLAMIHNNNLYFRITQRLTQSRLVFASTAPTPSATESVLEDLQRLCEAQNPQPAGKQAGHPIPAQSTIN